jgi:hypothetical protein
MRFLCLAILASTAVDGFAPSLMIRHRFNAIGRLVGGHGGFDMPLRKRHNFARMQTEFSDYGDSPSDVLKWTRERENEKTDKQSVLSKKRYGEWDSPITSKLVTAGSTPLSRYESCAWCRQNSICSCILTETLVSPKFDGEDLYWLERRTAEGGRQVSRV